MKKLFVLFVALAMVGAFTVPAAAADWSFYGSGRMSTFWDSFDAEVDTADDDGLTWALQGNSRVGARAKGDVVGGRFEYGTGVNLRLLYGTWKMGGGRLLVGQTYSPVNIFISNQVWASDNDMLNFGGLYGGRRQEISYAVGGFEVALINPSTGLVGADGDVDVSIPKIEAAYIFSADAFSVGAVAGYQTFAVEKASVPDYDVDSYVAGIYGTFNMGPAYINANVAFGQNIGNYGIYQSTSAGASLNAAGAIEDTDTISYLAVVGFKAGDMATFELGYGMSVSSYDTGEDDEVSAFYAQAVLVPVKGVKIIPEIGFIDYAENRANADQGENTYFGAQWRIDF